MKSSPFVSIAIPTFNRLNYLKQSLETLIPQALLHNVEICVSDNNSSDGTSQFLSDIVKKHNFIKCNIYSERVSIDENMLTVISMASGKYVYPLGDDDVIPEGCLDYIITEASRGGDLIAMNGWHTDPSLKKIRKHIPDSIAGSTFTRPDLAILTLWNKLPFGSFMAIRECFLKDNFQPYLGTSHAYAGSVWDMLSIKFKKNGSCNVRCTVQPVVLLRGADKTWKNNEARILFYEVPTWFEIIGRHDIYKMPLNIIRSSYMSTVTSMRLLVYLRANNQINCENVKCYSIHCNEFQKIKMRLISMVPCSVPFLIVKVRNSISLIYKEIVGLVAALNSKYL